MKRLWKGAGLVLAQLGFAAAASALPVTLTLVPVPSDTSLVGGQSLTVDVVVDGLFDAGEIALEAFELDLAFDKTRLEFDSLSFGTSLGDPNDEDVTFVLGPGNPNVNGVVEMGEFSFLSEVELLALQSAPFTLASIMFTALANPGDVTLELIGLDELSLLGVEGAALGIDNGLAEPSALLVTVPEPGTAVLLLSALVLARRRRAR